MGSKPRLVVVFVLSLTFVAAVPSCARAGDEQGEETQQSSESDEPTVAELEKRARARELGDEDYPLHDHPREVSGEVDCPEIELVEYNGEVIAYNQAIEINKAFRKRLIRFEKIVSELAVKLYGRAPAIVVHAGGHTCKTVGGRGEKLSEHAFGHAIDVIGFDFEAAPGEHGEEVARIAKAFSVRLEDHWGATEGFDAKHSLFLHLLADALKERGPFSTMLGPAYKGHDKIFHFDFGPQFFFRI